MTPKSPFDADIDAALCFIRADIDKACAEELERARSDAERARRSLGHQIDWCMSDREEQPFCDRVDAALARGEKP